MYNHPKYQERTRKEVKYEFQGLLVAQLIDQLVYLNRLKRKDT